MLAGSRATHRGAPGAAGVTVALRAPRRAWRGALASLLLALGLIALAWSQSGCQDCAGTSLGDDRPCRSDLDCPAAQACSPGGVCTVGAGECTATDECPRLAPDACNEADVVCRGGACRYDLACLGLGGRVTGLFGRGLVIANGGEKLTIDANDAFQFANTYGHNDAYDVSISQQPNNPGQTCIVTDGAGRFNVSDVATVRVTCAFLPEDQDGDRICDGETLSDACINILDNCLGVSNTDQADRDIDGQGDACDPCTDRDGDGYGRAGLDQSGCPSAGDDCDDLQAAAHPDEIERCGDGIDNDCDGLTDEVGCQKPYTAPVAVADAYVFAEDHAAVDLQVLSNDRVWDDPSAHLTITGTTAPSGNGAVVIAPGGGRLRYTPRPDFNGEETFAYSVADGHGGLSNATVTVTLTAVNDPPTATPDSFILPEDSPVATLDVLGNDSAAPDEGEPLSVVAIGQTSAGGSASLLLGGNIQYRPPKDYVGVETFTYILTDGHPQSSAVGQVTITITPVNDVPYLVVSLPDQVVAEDDPWTWVVPANTFADVDQGDILTLSASLADGSTLPAWLAFDAVHASFSGTARNDDVGQLFVDVRATDLGGASVGDVFALTVLNTNDAPTVAVPLTTQTAVEGTPWSFVVPAVTFTDVDAGDTLTYRATLGSGAALPTWLTFDRAARTFSGTPKNSDVGGLAIAVLATDRAGAVATAPFQLAIRNINQIPSLAHPLPDQQATEDAPYAFVVPADTFSDPDPGDEVLRLTARRADGTPLPTWLVFTPATRAFAGTPANADVGVFSVAVIATDAAGATASDVFALTVANTNDPPTVSAPLTDRAVDEGVFFAWSLPTAAFVDPDVGDSLVFSAGGPGGAALPEWLTFDPAIGLLQGLPDNAAVGDHTIVITARDVAGATASASFVVHVRNVNAAPRVTAPLPDASATEDAPFTFVVPPGTFADEDPGDALALTAALTAGSPLPAWLTFDPLAARFAGTPDNGDVGALVVGVTATDLAGASVTDLFALTVANTNDAPLAVAPLTARSTLEDLALTWILPATTFADVDAGDVLAWSVALADGSPLPAWLDFDPGARLLSGTPTNADVGALTLRVTVTDLAGATADLDVDLVVVNVNDPPQVTTSLDAAVATEDAPFTWTLPAGVIVDVDPGDVLAFSATRTAGGPLPGWLTFDPAARRLWGTPRNADVGTVVLTLKAVDLAGATASVTLPLTVVNTNDHPVVVTPIADRTVTARSGFAFFIPPNAFADPDVGDTLSYYVTLDGEDGLPGFVTFDAPEKVFYGTPGDADVGTYALRITATDAGGLAVASVFHLTVLPAPTGDLVVLHPIADQQATEELAFALALAADTFQGGQPPVTLAADLSDGAPLPAWLDFEPITATFAGTPTHDDVGALAVRVVATDEAGATASDRFTLTVVNVNDPPLLVLAPDAQDATQGVGFAWVIPAATFFDADAGDVLTWTLTRADGGTLPAWLAFDPVALLVSGTPGDADVGAVTLRVTATDPAGAAAFVDVDLTVLGVNDPPHLALPIPDQAATEDVAFAFTLAAGTFTDPDLGDALTLTARLLDGAALPGWLSFDGATFAGTPDNGDVGALAVEVTTTDPSGERAADAFVLTVANVNDAPTVVGSVDDQQANVGATWAFVLPAGLFSDVDAGDALTLGAARDTGVGLPAWLTFYPQTGLFLGAPAAFDVGALRLRVTATDGAGAAAYGDFALRVVGAQPPEVADTRAPRVLSHDPPDGAALGPSEPIIVRFDEAVDPATVDEASLQVLDGALDPVAGAWSQLAGAWVFHPDASWAPGDYAVFVEAAVTDLAGNALDESGPEDDFTFAVGAGFASPAWRAATPHLAARGLDTAVVAAGDDVTALWLEGIADNELHLRYRASADGGASFGAAVDAGFAVATWGRIIAMRYDGAGGFMALWMADDGFVSTQCTMAASCVTTFLGRYGGGRAGAASAEAWLAGDVVAWRDPAGSPSGAGLRARRWDGASWGPLETISVGALDWATVSAAGDEVHALWVGAGVARRRALGAAGWAPAETVATASGGAFGTPSYALAPGGAALFAWAAGDEAGGAWRIHAARRAGGGWVTTLRDAAPTGVLSAPDALVARIGAGGEAVLAWQIADTAAGASRVGIDACDGATWSGATLLGAAGAGASALAPPVLDGAVLANGRAVALVGWGDAAAQGAQLGAVDVELATGGANWWAPALLEPRAASAGPWGLEGFRLASDGVDRVGFASALGVGSGQLGGAWSVTSARDALFGADVAEAGAEDSEVVRAALGLDVGGAASALGVTGEDVARVVAATSGAAWVELARRGTSEAGAASAAVAGPSLARGAGGDVWVARALASAPVPGGGGACGALTEPVTALGRRAGASGAWGALSAVTLPLSAFSADCASAFPEVAGQALAVDGAGRAVVAWRLAGAPDAVHLAVVDREGAVWSAGTAATGGAGAAEADAVRLAAAGNVAAVVVDDPSGGAGQAGARAVGVYEDLDLPGGGVWASTAALFPDATAIAPASVAVAADPGGDVVLVAGVTDAGGASGRLAWRPVGADFAVVALTASGGASEVPSVWPRVDVLDSGAVCAWVEVTAPVGGGRALEAWDVAGPAQVPVLADRLDLGARAVSVLDVAVRADGVAAALWTMRDATDSYDLLWVAPYAPGAGWGAPVFVDDPAGLALDLGRAVVTASGQLVVAWRGDRGDGTLSLFWKATEVGAPAFSGPPSEVLAPAWAAGADLASWLLSPDAPLTLIARYGGVLVPALTTW